MPRIDTLLERQHERLIRLADADLRAMLRAYDSARRELLEQMRSMTATGRDVATPWTAQRTRVALALAEDGIRSMVSRLDAQVASTVQVAGEQAIGDLLAVIRRFEPEFRLTGNQVEIEALRRISERNGLALHRYSLDRYGRETIDDIQIRLSAAMARGEGTDAVVQAIAGPDGVLAQRQGRAALIHRMETYRSYNSGHLDTIRASSDVLDVDRNDPILKKIVERKDHRNHPASRAADGLTALPDEDFRLPAADILAQYRMMYPKAKTHRIGGMVWERRGDVYVGQSPPIHFNDRGRIIPWRKSWEIRR